MIALSVVARRPVCLHAPWVQVLIRSFDRLLRHLDGAAGRRGVCLVGVDGCGGSGKSTFAGALARAGTGVEIVHMDDFYRPAAERLGMSAPADAMGADFDWPRLGQAVLEPLARGEQGRYQRYDWATDALAGWHEVEARGVVVIEGIYALRAELRDIYDVRIWVECPYELRLARGMARDGEAMRWRWEQEWMPLEDRYVAAHAPHEAADLVVDGSGAMAHDPWQSFAICVADHVHGCALL